MMGIKSKSFEDTYGNYFFITFEGDLTRVQVFTIDGVHATGNARRSQPDEYDETFGETLAMARAINRVTRKLEKKMIASTK